MIHKVLRNTAQFSGGFTDLFILGTNRAYSATTKTWGSDFTAAAVTQSYNLIQLSDSAGVPLYVVGYPLAMAVVKYPFSATTADAKLDVGQTGAATAFLAGTAADLETTNKVVLPAAAAVPFATTTASQYLTATLTSVVTLVNALVPLNTANGVDIWIYATLLPYREWLLNREA